jgi:N-formylglutamate deformylase
MRRDANCSIICYADMTSTLIVHLPHDSADIPPQFREQFVLGDEELATELLAMTDAHTAAMFRGICAPENEIRAPVSRLLVDVERFADDALEVMASHGMGVIYTHTSQKQSLRRPLSEGERSLLLREYYHTHHERFTGRVTDVLQKEGRALILDAHSFPEKPQPSSLDQNQDRPEICLGTDTFHTPPHVREAFVSAFAGEGFSVRVDAPYAGAIVPAAYYRQNVSVSSVMIEVNRMLYMNEKDGTRLSGFDSFAERIRNCCLKAIKSCG